MKFTKYILASAALAFGLGAAGCSSNSSCADGGICNEGGAGGSAGTGGAGGTPGQTLYALSAGTFCYDILSIAPGYSDGCGLGVATYVGTPTMPSAIPVSYYAAATTVGGEAIPAGTVVVGNDGSLGRGVVNQNAGTLLRNGMPVDTDVPSCTWAEGVQAQFQLTATNKFNISVTETRSNFDPSCATVKPLPAGGTCTSTWTFGMAIEDPQVLSAAAGCQ